jgi:hypothetical protein
VVPHYPVTSRLAADGVMRNAVGVVTEPPTNGKQLHEKAGKSKCGNDGARGFLDFGNPAAMERALVRPVTLRPRLSVGFALSFVKADYKGREWF